MNLACGATRIGTRSLEFRFIPQQQIVPGLESQFPPLLRRIWRDGRYELVVAEMMMAVVVCAFLREIKKY